MRMKKPRDDAYGSEKGIRLEFALRSMVLIFGGLIFLYSLLVPAFVAAHPGGLAADGCHNDRKNGGRHCHRANASRNQAVPTTSIAPRREPLGPLPSAGATQVMETISTGTTTAWDANEDWSRWCYHDTTRDSYFDLGRLNEVRLYW